MTQEARFAGGHQDSVLCLACSVDGVLASGGESGELCLWSVEKPGLLRQVSGLSDADVTSVCFSVKQPHVLCAAVGESVLLFDSRDVSEPVHQFKFNSEEINQVTLNEKENFLAACDDSGEIKIIDFEGRKLFKTLRGHENICSSAKFCPKKTWGMVSGGLDQNVILWDFSRGKKLKICNMQDFVSEDGPVSAYMFNPPLVHSVDISGQTFACGLGNSVIQTFRLEGKKSFRHTGTLEGHSQGVSQVHFPQFQAEDALVSAGNDGKIIVWDLASNLESHAASSSKKTVEDEGAVGSAESVKSHIVQSIDHGSKINWLASGCVQEKRLLFVADVSPVVTAYSLGEDDGKGNV
ncbi:PREDICTED: WD repeat-containing protein 53-like [Branchiostoma belcheri]|uniref:WD repeat-containing protein 53-like n=1 Tax=Branchiostoma belcheri TaxID=7741 RepID=A0A6P4Z8D5_BRABE|nr:PREDICTED: WD repeat-containing protein 53-like [Branchiostoma belcheri]XP_019627341.1 PREDICTED: WD repeat-containing protein 53-like [Branchiostoma belcheri]XP_019627342.1 PREDICTED: WD repeat-containing protein 53-like [Branchiostoma belcheri]